MPEDEVTDQFGREFHHAKRDLELEITKLPQALPETPTATQSAIVTHIESVLRNILSQLSQVNDPKMIFTQAVKGLGEVEQERFLLENMLEALKRGENLAQIIQRFRRLGLTDVTVPKIDGERREPESSKFLLRMRKKLGKATLILSRVAITALKATAKFVEVTPSIGFIGPIPTVSFQLQLKGTTLDEIIELVQDSLEHV